MLTTVKVAVLVAVATAGLSSQAPSLAVVSAGPRGELTELADAGEVRLVFSEPMVALGDAAVTSAPPWIAITPAIRGAYYWSGTRTLIFTPDPSAPTPYATRFTVRVDRRAASTTGRALDAPFELSFTTPTVRLLSAIWYRKAGHADSPVVVGLRFNQPVRPSDVAAHTRLRPAPHPWERPTLQPEVRARLARTDPAGLARFDAKVSATASIVAGGGNPLDVVPAVTWDERRLPPGPNVAVLETIAAPLPESWLAVTVDGNLTGVQGTEMHAQQATTIRLEPAFFANQPCVTGCDPSAYNSVSLRAPVNRDALARAFSVRDLSDPRAERPVVAANVPTPRAGATTYFSIQDPGFPRQPPDSTWLLSLDSSLAATDGQTLGYPWMAIVENVHEQAFMAFDGAVWESGAGSAIPVTTRNVTKASEWVAAIAPSEILTRLRSMSRGGALRPQARAEVMQITARADAVEAHGLDLRDVLSSRGFGIVAAAVNLDETIPGAYQPRGQSNPVRSTLLQVTNLGVSVKDSPLSTLVFVTNLDTGAPVAQATVAIAAGQGDIVWRGVTGRDGVAMAPALPLRSSDGSVRPEFVVTAERDGDVAYVASDWFGPQPFRWGLSYEGRPSADRLRGSVFTDRGAYRQGDAVHVKSVLRFDALDGVRLAPADSRFDVIVRDPRGREVDKRTIAVNAWSTTEWTWPVPSDAALGRYDIGVRLADAPASAWVEQASGSFLVAQYRRPDFRVDASLTGTPPVAGTALRATVDARYLFGAGVASQPVSWRLTRTATQEVPRAIRQRFPEERYAFGYLAPPPTTPYTGALIQVATRTGVLDGAGHLAVEAATAGDVDAAYAYAFEGDVESAGGQHIANRASLVVHPAPFYVGVKRIPFFVDTKAGAALEVVATALDGQTLAGVPIAIALLRQEWQWGATSGPSGGPSWERKEILAGEWSATTTDGAPAALQIPVRDAGSYVLRATARDAGGRRTRTDVPFYAVGSGRSSWKVDGNRIDLVPERKTWKPGESARILIQSPWDRATALLTVEREGIRSHRQFDVTSTQDTVEVPLTEADVPNVYVSVMLVKGRTSDELGADGSDLGKPSYRVGYTELTVDDAAKRLEVTVSTDRDTYRPKQPLTVSVSVANAQGRPAAGEVTLWVVDYGLLSLTDYHTPDVIQAIYARRPLAVMTQDNRERLMSRRVLATDRSASIDTILAQSGERIVQVSTSQVASAGGGRGGAMLPAAFQMAPPPPLSAQGGQVPAFDLRTDFRPVVFWLGSATTGADGRAATTVTIPDSLTSYRVMAVAGDAASRFGWAEREITVSRPLTLLPEFPRFLTKGDRAAFGAILTNSTAAAGDAVVTIRSIDPDVIAFGTVSSRTIRIAPGATVPVHFDATARASGTARVQMTVKLGGETDAFETSLPVTVPARLETMAAYGETTSRAVERVTLPAGLVPTAGGLSIELASTALVGLGESARYLDEYPYTCAEQKASRALALLLTADLGGAFNLADVKPAAARAAATATLDDLYGYQCGDGGFTLWPGMCQSSSAYLTAYVLHVYKVAGTLGVRVDQNAINRALGFLQNQLRQPPPEVQWWPAWAASQAYAVKVLTDYGRNPNADIARLSGMADRLPIFALSYLADALGATGDRGPRYQNALRLLGNALRIDADRAHVEEINDASLEWLWNTNVRATAAVLDGLARRNDDPTFVAPLVRWLIGARTNGRWGTTHENAAVLEALVTYYRAFETDAPNMTAAVALDGRTIGAATFNGRSTTAHSVQVSMADLVRDAAGAAAGDLVISRAGTGRVYYTSRLQYLAPEAPTMVERGMRVERRYEKIVARAPAPSGTGAAADFAANDLVRVTLTITLPREGRYIALSDPLPAGFEAVDANLRTTATDLVAQPSTQYPGTSWLSAWRRGGFDHVEVHDDRVLAFATRLAAGAHEFSYLVRATTSGVFTAAGAQAEAMYAPDVKGRSAASVLQIR